VCELVRGIWMAARAIGANIGINPHIRRADALREQVNTL
jgi:hypothetical protein